MCSNMSGRGLLKLRKYHVCTKYQLKKQVQTLSKLKFYLSSEEWRADHILIKISFQSFNYNHTFL